MAFGDTLSLSPAECSVVKVVHSGDCAGGRRDIGVLRKDQPGLLAGAVVYPDMAMGL